MKQLENSEEVECASGQKCWEVNRKVSHRLITREGFMKEAGTVLDLKDRWALDEQRGRDISRIASAGADT